MKTTVCALLYGDFQHLTTRCLGSIKPLYDKGLVELRIGLNEVCKFTADYVADNFPSAFVLSANPQIYKYPMMHKLFNDKPLVTQNVMWFDDDSYVKAYDKIAWLEQVETTMSGDVDMLGAVYKIRYTDNQKSWCKAQPWYKGKPISSTAVFATGGWWCLKTEVTKKFDWPASDLKHCGGDVALGQLVHQNGLKLKNFNTGVAINADIHGHESKAPRRGASRTEKPIGM